MNTTSTRTSQFHESKGLMRAGIAPDVRAVDVSVVIVNYNVRDFLAQALTSLQRAAGDLELEAFVVDNNSVDGSAELVRRDFPWVTLIENDRNVGFSAANNQAIRLATGRYLLILNPDTILQEDTLRVLVEHLDAHVEAGAVGCQILNPDGTFAPESRRAFPSPTVAFYRVSGFSKLFPGSPVFGRYNMTFLPRGQEAEVDALSGSCMLVRHAALHVAAATYRGLDERARQALDHGYTEAAGVEIGDGAGLLDETFFMYGEDLDWCYRIQKAGWRIRYTPDTRIIHYKGESTKKGELRYVRLFYGAMLHFIEKHFTNRYSRIFAIVLRFGIMIRAAMTLVASAARRFRWPAIDFALVLASVALVGVLRSWQAGAGVSPRFLATVPPAYAVAVIAGVALAGGYRRHRRHAIRPVLTGAAAGLLVVSAVSFFLKDIAFSRVVVGLSFGLIIPVLLLMRAVRRNTAAEVRRAVVVGSRSEAERLQQMLVRHAAPPFILEGYIDPDRQTETTSEDRVPSLGSIGQLRDVVRLRRITEVVFAAAGLPNTSTFTTMQQLRDLPVQFRMLLEGREHVIGKASVEDLAIPALVEMGEAATVQRSPAARRAFEVSVAMAALVLYPLLYVLARVSRPDSTVARIAAHARLAPKVLSGRRALVGYTAPARASAAENVGLQLAAFDVAESLPAGAPGGEDIGRAYLMYARHQSAALDCSIMLRSLKNRR